MNIPHASVVLRSIRGMGLLALLACALASGCATAPYTGRSQFITMSESEEMTLGISATDQILQKTETETDTPRAARVEAIGTRIAGAADRPDFEWEFHTIPSDVINAFCLPGGKVFVYTALLDLVGENDDELAAVMGHEVAHAIARHGAERVSQTRLAGVGQILAGVAVTVATGSSAAGEATLSGYGIVAQLGLLLPYSRLHESEADHIGTLLAAKAGYDPRAAISLWEKMGEATKGKEGPSLLSTHPMTEQRIADLERNMPKALEFYQPPR